MSEAPKKTGSRRKLTPAQLAQRARREREAEQREKFELPEAGPNYGSPVLVKNDERIKQIADMVRGGLVVSAAAEGVGIPGEWHERWMATGLSDFLNGRKSLEATYYDEVRRAYVKHTGDLDRALKKAKTAHEAQTYRFLLERTRADWYAVRSEKSGGSVVEQLADLFSAHEATPPSPIASDVAPMRLNGAASHDVATTP